VRWCDAEKNAVDIFYEIVTNALAFLQWKAALSPLMWGNMPSVVCHELGGNFPASALSDGATRGSG
jgi:hypothetical protein